MEAYDKEIEFALMNGLDPDAHISNLLGEACGECGHSLALHGDKYGCEHERGDVWIEGTNCGGWVAAPPCGCKEGRTV